MTRPIRLLILLIPILVLFAIYTPAYKFIHNQYDDAYITYRYAINFSQGNGLVFNIGEHTDAASSFLYALVLSVCWFLHLRDLELIGALIGVVSLGFISILVYKLSAYIASDRRTALIVAVACGLNGFLAGWTLSGMETLPWAALVLFAIYLMVIDARPALICVAVGAAAFTRFEGILLVVPYFLLAATRPRLIKRLIPLSAVILSFAIFYIVKHAYYGVWISHAFQMKRAADYYKPAPRELIKFWTAFCSVPLLLSTPTLFNKKYRYVLAYIALSIVATALGPKSDWSRYSVHLLPLLYAFSAPVLTVWLADRRIPTRRLTFALVVLAMFGQALVATWFNWHNMSNLVLDQEFRKDLGAYINTHFDKNEYIASSDLGRIAYVAIDHPFVDLIALTSSDVLADYRAGKTADAILKAKNVRYIADTYHSDTSIDRFNELLEEFPSVKRKSEFAIDSQHPIFARREEENIQFIITRIMKAPQAVGESNAVSHPKSSRNWRNWLRNLTGRL